MKREVYVRIAGRRDRKRTWEGGIFEERDSWRIVGGTVDGKGGV